MYLPALRKVQGTPVVVWGMQWVIAGLGNPGEAYKDTRHNAGRDMLILLAKKERFSEWKEDKKSHVRTTKGVLFGKKVQLVLPDTYMNNSGRAFRGLITSKKDARQLVVLQDELDMPVGEIKISFGSGSGGHRGVESVQQGLKTKEFVRIRIGISPVNSSGKLKKPAQEKIIDFVLGAFSASETEKLKKARRNVATALELLLTTGLPRAMTEINSR